MHESIVLKIPSNIQCLEIVKDVIRNTCKTLPLTQDDVQALLSSTEELIHNAVTHAYKGERGYIEISLHPFKTGLRIDVHDWGIPMSYKKHKSVPIEKEASAGFNRIYDMMDIFEYHNLGKAGKKFVIIKYASYPFPLHTQKNISIQASLSSEKEGKEVTDPNIPITIREFAEGDEEGIAHLIYKNYGHSFIKDLFYYPQKILEFHGKEFYSVVAECDGRIVGHFAFVLVQESTIAEIGIVVVDPLFKGKGIMNRMLELILKKAEDIGLDAVFGGALMYHTYSQKSNLRHGFAESTMMLGKTLANVTLENNELTKKYERGSVLVGYRFFHKTTKSLYLPKVYKDQIKLTYLNAEIFFVEKRKKEKKKVPEHVFLTYQFDPPSNIAMIRVDYYAKDFKHKFLLLVSQLRAKHCDMIYADISLEKIPQINKVVKIMNKKGFFYSGVMFLYHEKGDYLRLQLKHSDKIGSKNYICYSNFCKKLSKYIVKDEERVRK